MARPRTATIEDRKKDIVDAVLGILAQKGYHDVRLDEVAARANVAKGTLYLYFRDKEALFSEVMKSVVSRLGDQITAEAPAPRALDELKRIARIETEFLTEYRDFLSHFSIRKSPSISPAATRFLKTWFESHVGSLAKVLDRGVAEGSIRRHDTREGALFFVALCRMFALHRCDGEASKEHIARLMDFFLNGVGAKS